jgi:hypothetical protein
MEAMRVVAGVDPGKVVVKRFSVGLDEDTTERSSAGTRILMV